MAEDNYFPLSRAMYAKLESIRRAADGQPYEDNWRNKYQFCSGILMIFEKDDLAGIRFYTEDPEDPFQISFFSSGIGRLEMDGETVVLKSKNSIYRFRDATDTMDENAKTTLCLNLFGPEGWL